MAKLFKVRLIIFCVAGIITTNCQHVKQAREANRIFSFEREIGHFAELIKAPGMAVCVANRDSIIYFGDFGYANLERQSEITDSTIFWLSSLTKPVTSLALAQMQSEQLFGFEDSLSMYPNKYFPKGQISGLQVKHVMSHTSESSPPGSIFLYNGNRFNMLFNIFDGVGRRTDTDFPLDPFFTEINLRIIEPLDLEHTLLSLEGNKYEAKKDLIVTPYKYNRSEAKFEEDSTYQYSLFANPGQGMLSSIRDLVSISQSIDKEVLIDREQYNTLTKPNIKEMDGTSYGLGWFTQEVKGARVHWAYGYGSSDASLMVKVPEKDLTLIVLVNSELASSTTRLGEGNILRSIPAIAFFKYFLSNENVPIQDYESVSEVNLQKGDCGKALLDELYTHSMVKWFLPDEIYNNKIEAIASLKRIHSVCPNYFDGTRLDQFYFLSTFDNPEILGVGGKIAKAYEQLEFHPVKCYYSSIIEEKLGNHQNAINLLEKLVDYNSFWDHEFMSKAHIKLSELYLIKGKKRHAIMILNKLIQAGNGFSVSEEYINLAKERLKMTMK